VLLAAAISFTVLAVWRKTRAVPRRRPWQAWSEHFGMDINPNVDPYGNIPNVESLDHARSLLRTDIRCIPARSAVYQPAHRALWLKDAPDSMGLRPTPMGGAVAFIRTS